LFCGQEVEKVLESGAATLMQQYATSLLTTMQRDIQNVVQKAMHDSFPAAWLPSGTLCDSSPLLVPLDSFDQIFEKPGHGGGGDATQEPLFANIVGPHYRRDAMGRVIVDNGLARMEPRGGGGEDAATQGEAGIVKGGSGRRKEDYGGVPKTYEPLVELCKCALIQEGTDACFWVEGVRALFPADFQEQSQPLWPSSAAQQLIDNPPCQLAKRFPGIIDSLVEKLKGDLKTKTESLILDAVSRRVRLFSDQIASVQGWRKKFTPNAVEISVVEAGSVAELTNDVVLVFLRYKRGMLRELQSSVRDRLAGPVNLRETCAEQRLEMISKVESLHRAKEGIFELLGLTTQEERQEWEERSR
jgi:hypothetical protein